MNARRASTPSHLPVFAALDDLELDSVTGGAARDVTNLIISVGANILINTGSPSGWDSGPGKYDGGGSNPSAPIGRDVHGFAPDEGSDSGDMDA